MCNSTSDTSKRKDRHTDRQKDKTDRQTDRKKDRETKTDSRQTETRSRLSKIQFKRMFQDGIEPLSQRNNFGTTATGGVSLPVADWAARSKDAARNASSGNVHKGLSLIHI